MQVLQLDGVQGVLKNAAQSTVEGVEAEIDWAATDSLLFGLDAEYINGRYEEFHTAEEARPLPGIQDLSGNRLPMSPPYRVKFDASYTWSVYSGDLTLRADATWIGRIYYTPFERTETSTPPSEEFSGFVTYDWGDWSVEMYGRNLADKRKLIFAEVASGLFGFPNHGLVNAPRTFGISAVRRW
jgi:outer membrane receptor protein involved in Fe transport